MVHGHAQTSRDWFQEYVTQGMIIIQGNNNIYNTGYYNCA